ncbi:ADP-forming succinate--CoA ligase subunit beta [Thermodesulfobacteriota bacterium]
MKVHEYQAKEILAEYRIPIPSGRMADTPEQVEQICGDLEPPYVLKAQVHAGGRGKGGGIKTADSSAQAFDLAGAIIGMMLVTPQTGKEGKLVRKLLVEESVDIASELYVGITVDRKNQCPVVIVSEAGGMEIEEVAARDPEKVIREMVDPTVGITPFQTRRLSFKLTRDPATAKKIAACLDALYRIFHEKDCSLVEINPLVITREGDLVALDAKLNFDDNALFRHKDVAGMRDIDEDEPLEVEASKHGLSYIKLDGSVGCMVNGAGLAMATMDIIKLAGAEPANFLDIGGGADSESVENAFRIILADANVKAVLINIFGGIVRCDRVAQGVIDAASKLEIGVPIVIRLEGTNAKKAATLLNKSKLPFAVADGLRDAAEKVASSSIEKP